MTKTLTPIALSILLSLAACGGESKPLTAQQIIDMGNGLATLPKGSNANRAHASDIPASDTAADGEAWIAQAVAEDAGGSTP